MIDETKDAVEALQKIAQIDPQEEYKNCGGLTPVRLADAFLQKYGYDDSSVLLAKAKRNRELDQLRESIAILTERLARLESEGA